jgi:hypothetical protein
MGDVLTRYYVKEEEFLDGFETAATVAAWFLKGAWTPNYHCNDAVRHNRDQLLESGGLDQLVFSGAAVYQGASGSSSVQIALRSSTRSVNLRVKRVGQELVAEKLLDKQVVAGV